MSEGAGRSERLVNVTRSSRAWRGSLPIDTEPDQIVELSRLDHTLEGFVALTELYAGLRNELFSTIGLDLSGASWISNCMAAPLAVILDRVSEGNDVYLTGLPRDKVRDTLCRCGFLPMFGLPPMHDGYMTSIKLERIPAQQGRRGAQYLRDQLAGRDLFPLGVSVGYRSRLLGSFAEVFVNAEQHADTTNLYVCGQFYPHGRTLRMSVMDGGRTIPANVAEYLSEPTSDTQAIEWAMGKGHTTSINQYGGNGLWDLRNFIASNGGKLMVVSGHGYWCQSGEDISTDTLEYPLPGTAIVWEMDVGDEQTYDSN